MMHGATTLQNIHQYNPRVMYTECFHSNMMFVNPPSLQAASHNNGSHSGYIKTDADIDGARSQTDNEIHYLLHFQVFCS